MNMSEVRYVHNLTRLGLMTFIMLGLHRKSKRNCRSRFRGDREQHLCDKEAFIPLRGGRGGRISVRNPMSLHHCWDKQREVDQPTCVREVL